MTEDMVERLVAHGGRRTAARQAIAEAIAAAGSHFTADDLAKDVQARLPSVNRSTIYRTLDLLEGAGVLDHVHLGHGRAVYHLAAEEHHHLVCEACEDVIELPISKLRPLMGTLDRDYGFQLDRRHFAIVGRCSRCR